MTLAATASIWSFRFLRLISASSKYFSASTDDNLSSMSLMGTSTCFDKNSLNSILLWDAKPMELSIFFGNPNAMPPISYSFIKEAISSDNSSYVVYLIVFIGLAIRPSASEMAIPSVFVPKSNPKYLIT